MYALLCYLPHATWNEAKKEKSKQTHSFIDITSSGYPHKICTLYTHTHTYNIEITIPISSFFLFLFLSSAFHSHNEERWTINDEHKPTVFHASYVLISSFRELIQFNWILYCHAYCLLPPMIQQFTNICI